MVQDAQQESQEDWTRISDLKPGFYSINVRLLVTEKGPVRHLRSKSTGRYHEVCDFSVSDATGAIKMTLWNEGISEVSCGETYELVRGYVRVYDECMFLSRARSSLIRKSEQTISNPKHNPDMSRPFAWRPKRTRKRSTGGRSFQGMPGREAKGYCSRKSF